MPTKQEYERVKAELKASKLREKKGITPVCAPVMGDEGEALFSGHRSEKIPF